MMDAFVDSNMPKREYAKGKLTHGAGAQAPGCMINVKVLREGIYCPDLLHSAPTPVFSQPSIKARHLGCPKTLKPGAQDRYPGHIFSHWS